MNPWEEPERFEISPAAFQAINPNRKLWTKAMSQILIGIGMNFLVLPVFYLEIILPFIGTCLMLVGFRTLRKKDVWFGRCFIVAAIHLFFILYSIILQATVYRSMIGDSVLSFTLTLTSPLITVVLLFCLWRGFQSACKEVGAILDCSVVLFLLAWYIALFYLVVTDYYGWLIFLFMAALLIFLLRRSFDLAWAIRAEKYTVSPVEFKISNPMWIGAVTVLLVLGLSAGYLFFQKYPMKWKLTSAERSSDTKVIEERLLQLGFPGELLEDLSDEDLQACQEASYVLMEAEDTPSPASEDLKLTTVAVKTSKDLEHWKIFHHFLWMKAPEFCGTETYYRCMEENDGVWQVGENFTGRVLYDKSGDTYVSPYYSLRKRTGALEMIPGHPWIRTYLVASFSFPAKAQRARGYLSYVMKGEVTKRTTSETDHEDVWELYLDYLQTTGMMPGVQYIHQASKKQYPVITAEEKIMREGGDVFDMYGSMFHFRSENGKEP